jgi:hypothetical protein
MYLELNHGGYDVTVQTNLCEPLVQTVPGYDATIAVVISLCSVQLTGHLTQL